MEPKKRLKISAVLILTASTLVLGSYTALNKKILLTIDGQTVKINTVSNTVESFLINEKINIEKGCRITPELDTKLKDNMEVVLTNPYNITVINGTNQITLKTNQETVEDVLKECNISLSSKDTINKELDSRLKPNDKIIVTRVKEEIYKIIREIPFETQYINDAKLLEGKTNKEIVGKKGKLEVTYKIVYKNGVEVSKEKVSEKILENPIKEVIRKGKLKTNTI